MKEVLRCAIPYYGLHRLGEHRIWDFDPNFGDRLPHLWEGAYVALTLYQIFGVIGIPVFMGLMKMFDVLGW